MFITAYGVKVVVLFVSHDNLLSCLFLQNVNDVFYTYFKREEFLIAFTETRDPNNLTPEDEQMFSTDFTNVLSDKI